MVTVSTIELLLLLIIFFQVSNLSLLLQFKPRLRLPILISIKYRCDPISANPVSVVSPPPHSLPFPYHSATLVAIKTPLSKLTCSGHCPQQVGLDSWVADNCNDSTCLKAPSGCVMIHPTRALTEMPPQLRVRQLSKSMYSGHGELACSQWQQQGSQGSGRVGCNDPPEPLEKSHCAISNPALTTLEN